MDNLKHTVEIHWGPAGRSLRSGRLECRDPDVRKSYGFATDAELGAFLIGVDEASGWLYGVVEEAP